MAITIRGDIDSLTIYSISAEDLDIDVESVDTKETQEEIHQTLESLVETGELDAITNPIDIRLANLEELEIDVDDDSYVKEEIGLNFSRLLSPIELEESEVGTVYLIRHYRGEAEISYRVEELDIEEAVFSLDYIDCSDEFDQFDILRESYLEEFCDTVVVDRLYCDGEELEYDEFIFNPQLIQDEIYIVKSEDGVKFLEKIDTGDGKLFGSELYLDEIDFD
jgi:hypothetical protein